MSRTTQAAVVTALVEDGEHGGRRTVTILYQTHAVSFVFRTALKPRYHVRGLLFTAGSCGFDGYKRVHLVPFEAQLNICRG